MSERAQNKNLENGKKTQFSKDNQPTFEQRSEAWAKKRKGKELAKAVMELAFKGSKTSPLKKMAAEYFGVEESDISVEMMMHFRQAEKAIQKADTQAYTALMNRAHGQPKQEVEVQATKIRVTRK